jgi:hypothetical protein
LPETAILSIDCANTEADKIKKNMELKYVRIKHFYMNSRIKLKGIYE